MTLTNMHATDRPTSRDASHLKIHPAAHSRRMLTVGMLAHKYFHQWAIFKYPKIVYSSQYQCQN